MKDQDEEEEARDKKRSRTESNMGQASLSSGPAANSHREKDTWSVKGKVVTREFRRPRQHTFTPERSGCPVDVNKLKATRVTRAISLNDGTVKVINDDWKAATVKYFNPFSETDPNTKWYGWCEFELEEGGDEEMKQSRESAPTSPT